MRVARENLTVLLNRLSDRGEDLISVSHPSDEVGELLTVELGAHDDCTIWFSKRAEAYARARNDVGRNHPTTVYEDLPTRREYINAVMASGIVPIDNYDDVKAFVNRYGDPDLLAGHPPVFVGLDTNLLPWRIDRILGLRDPEEGVGYVNGLVLATGIRDELTWDHKCHETEPFVDAFGDPFEEYWNQPLGSARIGRLGLLTYRAIRDIQQADEIQCDRDDDKIVAAYDEYDHNQRCQMLLLSNDRNFVEPLNGQDQRRRPPRRGVATYSQWRYRQTFCNSRLTTTYNSRTTGSCVDVVAILCSDNR